MDLRFRPFAFPRENCAWYRRANSSTTSKPISWRVPAYLVPILPNPTTSLILLVGWRKLTNGENSNNINHEKHERHKK